MTGLRSPGKNADWVTLNEKKSNQSTRISERETPMDIRKFTEYRDKILKNVGQVIVGKDEKIELVTTAFICSGHVLLEDVPGTGKTMLLRAFAKTIGGDFKRIQFTPDLLPSDLTGINFYSQKSGEFEFRPGPLFSNLVLADEINRATPRTQSALLEAMEERQITVDGKTMKIEEPFMVMATQNPLESYGTFPLPEAQMDRFFMRLSLGYMERKQEMGVLSRVSTVDIINTLEQTVTREETEYVRREFVHVRVSEPVLNYMMDIIQATREHTSFVAGVSTRGGMALYKAAQVTAALRGREYVIPEDVKFVAPCVLAHRLMSGGGTSANESLRFMNEILNEVKVPLEDVE